MAKTEPLVCAYRHCAKVITGKSGQKFCCPEHRRREKAFRSGKAQDESYFRAEKPKRRTCLTCRQLWGSNGSVLNRCPDCRKKARQKVCVECGEMFEDTSPKNTRKSHPECVRKKTGMKVDPQRKVASSSRLNRRRVTGARAGSQGRLDDLRALTKGTTTWWGRVAEMVFLEFRPGARDMNHEYGAQAPYDFADREYGRVDVRSAKARVTRHGNTSWKFSTVGLRESCDTVFLVGWSADGRRVERMWLTPSAELPDSAVWLTPESREYGSKESWQASWNVGVAQQCLDRCLALPDPERPAKRTLWLNDVSWLHDETRFNRGRRGELLYRQLYPGSVDMNVIQGTSSAYDFRDRCGTRVNVKTSWWYGARSVEKDRWSFSRGFRAEHGCDVYSCLCLDTNGRLIREYRIPADAWGDRRTIHVVGEHNKWASYQVPLRVSGLVAHAAPENAPLDVEEASHEIRRLDSTQLSYLTSAVQVLSRVPFPEAFASKDVLCVDWARLQATEGAIAQSRVVAWSAAGLKLADVLFPHRFDARYQGNPSLRQAWADPRWLYKAARFQKSVGDPLLPKNIVRALKALLRAPTNFRPAVAKTLVERFCPPDGLVLDPCAGYGGRALGVLAAGRRYLGVDPHPQASEAFERLFRCVGAQEAKHIGEPFEDVCGQLEEADFALTSPPYFNAERYSDDASQSWVRYPTWEAWVDGFLTKLIQGTYGRLKNGAVFCLNIADVGKYGRKWPLVEEALRLADQSGFALESTLHLPLKQMGKAPRSEPILVLRKP